jgi:hypothetical protein
MEGKDRRKERGEGRRWGENKRREGEDIRER